MVLWLSHLCSVILFEQSFWEMMPVEHQPGKHSLTVAEMTWAIVPQLFMELHGLTSMYEVGHLFWLLFLLLLGNILLMKATKGWRALFWLSIPLQDITVGKSGLKQLVIFPPQSGSREPMNTCTLVLCVPFPIYTAPHLLPRSYPQLRCAIPHQLMSSVSSTSISQWCLLLSCQAQACFLSSHPSDTPWQPLIPHCYNFISQDHCVSEPTLHVLFETNSLRMVPWRFCYMDICVNSSFYYITELHDMSGCSLFYNSFVEGHWVVFSLCH